MSSTNTVTVMQLRQATSLLQACHRAARLPLPTHAAATVRIYHPFLDCPVNVPQAALRPWHVRCD